MESAIRRASTGNNPDERITLVFFRLCEALSRKKGEFQRRLFSEEAALGQSLNFQPVHNTVCRLTTFGNSGYHQIGTTDDIAASKDFGLLVWKALSLPSGAMMRPCESSSTLCFASHSMLCGRKPNAMITASAGTICSEPATISARRRPLASGSPISVRTILRR